MVNGTTFLSPESSTSVYVADYNKDGFTDILHFSGSLVALYRNNGEELIRSHQLSNLTFSGDLNSALFFDYDNDGDQDLYLLSEGKSMFLENEDGHFVQKQVGLDREYERVRSTAAADYTGNGCLDVFVAQFGKLEEKRPPGFYKTNVSVREDNGADNLLFRGNCKSFEEVSEKAGVDANTWTHATTFADFTNDGYPDIHVANDFNNDILYINNKNGTFDKNILPEFTNRNGMSSEVADINQDGYLDIFVTNIAFPTESINWLNDTDNIGSVRNTFEMRLKGNNLLINKGGGVFKDKAEEYNATEGGLGWSALFEDFDNDGEQELIHADTGGVRGVYLSGVSEYNADSPPNMWDRSEDGFQRISPQQSGLTESRSYGIVALDYDFDGDLDVITDNTDGSFKLYENQNTRNSLQLRLVSGNSTVVGSRAEITYGNKTSSRVMTSESDSFSQSSRTLHFGTGKVKKIDELAIEWRDGTTETYEDLVM